MTHNATKNGVLKWIEEHKSEAVELLQDLVRIPSVNPSPRSEKDIANFIAKQMRELGMDVRQIEPEPNRISNIGRLGGTDGKPVLLFYAHEDTVPPGPIDEWIHPPFAAEIHDGKLYGRGASDMKLGLAGELFAVKALSECGVKLRGDILMITCADEEQGGHKGLEVMVKNRMLQADWGVYGESTLDEVIVGHRGYVRAEIKIKGKSVHTALKQTGVNAIVKMAKVVQALDSMQFTGWNEHPIVTGNPIISVNIVSGGLATNVVPDSCNITCDIRTIPGQTTEAVVDDIERVMQEVKSVDPELEWTTKITSEAPASSLTADEPIVRYVQEAAEEVLGYEPRVTGMAATSDSRWLTLYAKIPTLLYSGIAPGHDHGHEVNEWVAVDDFIKCVKVYATLCFNLLA